MTLLLLSMWVMSLSVAIGGTCYAYFRLRHPHTAVVPEVPISIIKPLKGVDNGLEENLLAFFRQDYPDFELLFCFAEEADPALALVKKIMGEYPTVKARVFVGQTPIGLNPKVNNIFRAYHEALNDAILISDSNIRPPTNYLRLLAPCLTEKIGVVTAVIAGEGASGIGGELEQIYLNTFHARWLLVSDAFSMTYVIGKTMFFRRSVLKKIGDWPYLSKFIAEDYQAGVALKELGYSVTLMPDPVPQFIGPYRFADFWHRHIRWNRIRKSQVPFIYFIEFFQLPVVSAFCGAFAIHRLFGYEIKIILMAHFAVWLAADSLLVWKVTGKLKLKWLFAWLLREVISLPMWAHTLLSSKIKWRGNSFRVLRGGLIESL